MALSKIFAIGDEMKKPMMPIPKGGVTLESVMREMIRCINELDARVASLENYLEPLHVDVKECVFGEIQ